MRDIDKTKEQLINELAELRNRISELEPCGGERKGVDEKLRESEEKYRTLVENATEAIFTVDYDGVYLFMNSVAAQQLGGQPEDLIGKTIWDVFPKEVAEHQVRGIREMIQSGEGRIRETETILRGERRWYRTSSKPINDHLGNTYAIVVIGTDITERKRAEEALRESQERYRGLFDSMMDGLVVHRLIVDENGKPVDYILEKVNSAAERILSWKREDIEGKRAQRYTVVTRRSSKGMLKSLNLAKRSIS